MDINEIVLPAVTVETRLNQVIAKAASIEERIFNNAFHPLTDLPGNIAATEKEWAEIVGLSSEEKLDTFLAFMNWDKAALAGALQPDVIVDDTKQLPAWALNLKQIFRDLPAFCTTVATGKEDHNVQHIILPFIKMAEAHVIAEADRLQAGITYNSGGQMVQVFSRRLVTLCVAVLDSEIYLNNIIPAFFTNGSVADLAGFDAWLERIERYPVLGRLLSVAYTNWANGITEFLGRLSQDIKMIGHTFFDTEDAGLLIDYSGDAGDVHCEGRSVAILTFSGGRKLVYKPKNLEIANAFFGLIDELNTVLPVKLATRKVIVRGDYTWEEFIPHKECTDVAEFPDFFRRIGMLTRLFQLCGARDFWLDNLVAHGNQPVFVDLEMVIQHLKEEGKDLLPSERTALDELEESVIKIGVISFPTPIGVGVKAEDLGTLASIKPFSSPFKLSLSADNNISMGINKSDDGFITWEKSDYLPSINGVFAVSAGYMDALQEGYADMNDALLQLRDKLLADNSCLYRFSGAHLRYIHRDTWTYMRIIKASTHPQALVSGIARDRSLFSLFKEVWEGDQMNRDKATILADEITSMRHLDIPLFNACGGSTSLIVDDTDLSFFSHSALQMMIARLESISSFDLEKHQQIIASTFYCGDHPAPAVTYQSTGKMIVEPAWQTYAKDCASLIMEQATIGPAGDMAWLGLDFQPHIDTHMLEVLKPDILSGTCGLSMLFTDLYTAYDEATYKTYALGSLASTLAIVKNSVSNFEHLDLVWGASDKPLFLGAYAGIGSQIIALEYAARHLGSAGAEAALDTYVRSVPLEKLKNYASMDFISGYPGLLFSLYGLRPLEELTGLATNLLTPKKAFPDHSAVLEVLPSLTPGYEYLEQILHHPDRSFHFSENPSTGELFTALVYSPDEISAGVFDALLSAELTTRTTRQLIDAAELALNLFDITGERHYLTHAKEIAAAIISRKEQTGSWFADSWAADIHLLSVVHGIGALCHLFLRLDQPGRFGSFRRLSTFKNLHKND